MKKIKNVTNRNMARFFFWLFIFFFIVFLLNKYTMNIIMAFVCLQLSIAFKTWDVIRSVQNGNSEGYGDKDLHGEASDAGHKIY